MNAESLMAEWLGWASQECELYCPDLEVTVSNPGQVDTWVSTSV